MILLIICFLIIIFYIISLKHFVYKNKSRNSYKNYYASYLLIISLLPTILILLVGNYFIGFYINNIIFSNGDLAKSYNIYASYESVIETVKEIKNGTKFEDINVYSDVDKKTIYNLATQYIHIKSILSTVLNISAIFSFISIFIISLYKISILSNFHKKIEKIIKFILAIFSTIAIGATIAILLSLFIETIMFFNHISILDFLFKTTWAPENSDLDPSNSFGIIPLLAGTFLISAIAIIVAIIIGVSCAIYMSEYMSERYRNIVKPLLEILAGIPSIVYGFFAAVTFAPMLVSFFKSTFNMEIPYENSLSAGIIMGIMILPFISSISDDVIRSLPNSLREAAMGMGSMKHETILKILLPSAMPGILGGVLLAISKAIGETMIVVMASSLSANLTLNPLEPVTTITTQISMLVQGDQEFNSPSTLSAFALAFILLIITLILNMLALKIVNKYKRKHG